MGAQMLQGVDMDTMDSLAQQFDGMKVDEALMNLTADLRASEKRVQELEEEIATKDARIAELEGC